MNRRAIIYAVSGLILLLPSLVFAQVFPEQLVPCQGPGACDACALVTLAQNILNFLVALSVFVAVIAFVYAGFLMVTAGGDEGQITKAKSTFSTVAIGFIIVLAAWLIVNVLLSALTGRGIDSWSGVLCGSAVAPAGNVSIGEIEIVSPQIGAGSGGSGQGSTEDDDEPLTIGVTGGALVHGDAVKRLEDNGVEVTSTGGPDQVYAECEGSGCTSLEGILEDTLSAPIAIKKACPTCDVKLTGGTEPGPHVSGGVFTHENGSKVDIDDTPSVNAFLEANLTRNGSRGSDPRYLDAHGNEYVRETTHWDLTVKRRVIEI